MVKRIVCFLLAMCACFVFISCSSNNALSPNKAPIGLEYNHIILDGRKDAPALGWKKATYTTVFDSSEALYYKDRDCLYFDDLGFAVYFLNDVTSSIAINHDSGASLYGGITVGMSSEDILSIIGSKPAIEDTDSFIYLIDVDGNFTEAIDKEQFSRAQFSLSFNFKDNLVETIIISNDF